jgi:hypothetical protein
MAKVVTTKLVDDLDGSPATKTVRLALDGKSVELDLSAKNVKRLEKAIAPFLSKGRAAGTRGTAPRSTRARKGRARKATRDYDIAALRKWAASRRIKVPARGRIPGAIVEQFKAEGTKRRPKAR